MITDTTVMNGHESNTHDIHASETNSGRAVRRLRSQELFAGHSRLLIAHDGVEYLLQVTRQGKLILTK